MTTIGTGCREVRRGVTLVELLVVIAVIGVLISITVSVMGKARTETEETSKASDLHQIVAMCTSYSAAHGGKTPFAPPDREEDGSVSDLVRIYLPQDGWVAFPYFAQSMRWQAYLHTNGFGVSELPGIPDPRSPNPFMTSPSYFASQSFLANSRYWAVDAVQQQEDWRVQSMSDVLSPSKKAYFYDPGSEGRSVVFSDGHVQRIPIETAPWVRNSMWDNASGPLATTLDGCRGRDL